MRFWILLMVGISACSSEHRMEWEKVYFLPGGENNTPHIGLAGPMAGITGDRLVIAGGANFPVKMPWEGGTKAYPRQAYIYGIEDGGLRLVRQQTLETAVAYPGNCSAEGVWYVAGGENESGPVNTVMKIRQENDALVTELMAPLPVPLTNGSLVSASGKLYFVGGENRAFVSDKIYAYSEASGWKEAYSLPYPVSHAVVVSDGKSKIYIAGGRKRNENAISTLYDAVLEADLASGKVQQIATLPEALAAGTGVWDEQGSILLFGGDNGETFHRVEALIAEIGRTGDAEKKKELNEQKAQLQRSHPGFSKICRKYNLKKKEWTHVLPLPGHSPVTTTALTYGDRVIIPSGEIRAGVRTNQILTGKQVKTYEK